MLQNVNGRNGRSTCIPAVCRPPLHAAVSSCRHTPSPSHRCETLPPVPPRGCLLQPDAPRHLQHRQKILTVATWWHSCLQTQPFSLIFKILINYWAPFSSMMWSVSSWHLLASDRMRLPHTVLIYWCSGGINSFSLCLQDKSVFVYLCAVGLLYGFLPREALE